MKKNNILLFILDLLDVKYTKIYARKYYEEHLDEVYSILKEGTTKANEKANKTLKEVKKAIMIDFFEE